jgi:hypothetical protein
MQQNAMTNATIIRGRYATITVGLGLDGDDDCARNTRTTGMTGGNRDDTGKAGTATKVGITTTGENTGTASRLLGWNDRAEWRSGTMTMRLATPACLYKYLLLYFFFSDLIQIFSILFFHGWKSERSKIKQKHWLLVA